MNILGTVLLFGGYTLVYAATARGGAFATEPWNGLLTDAYLDTPTAQGGVAMENATLQAANDVSQGTGVPFTRPRSRPTVPTAATIEQDLGAQPTFLMTRSGRTRYGDFYSILGDILGR